MEISQRNLFGLLIKANYRIRRIFSNVILFSPSKQLMKRIGLIMAVFLFYLYRRSKKVKPKLICKRTEFNLNLIEWLSPLIKKYKPTFFLPTAMMQMTVSEFMPIKLSVFEKQPLPLPDGGEMVLEWFPTNFTDFDPVTPIVVFNLGVVGFTDVAYCQALCQIIKQRNWRMVVMNRRGFGISDLKNPIFIQKNESLDLGYILKKIKELFPRANIYLLGVSAGANYSTKYMGQVGKDTPVKAFVSVSNPFNIGRISFNMKFGFKVKLLSKFIANSIKQFYKKHYNNKHFLHLLKESKLDMNKLENELKHKKTCWKVDKYLTSKLGGFDSVYDYYHNIASEHLIHNIKVPTLFLNNSEDPICVKEMIPVEKIYANDNTMLLFMKRGGHIEYMSGWGMEWWGYEMAIRYFEFFEADTN